MALRERQRHKLGGPDVRAQRRLVTAVRNNTDGEAAKYLSADYFAASPSMLLSLELVCWCFPVCLNFKKGNYIFTPNGYHKNSRLLPTVEMRNLSRSQISRVHTHFCAWTVLKKKKDENLDLLAELKVLTQKVTKRLNRRAGRKERGRGRERGKGMVFVQ